MPASANLAEELQAACAAGDAVRCQLISDSWASLLRLGLSPALPATTVPVIQGDRYLLSSAFYAQLLEHPQSNSLDLNIVHPDLNTETNHVLARGHYSLVRELVPGIRAGRGPCSASAMHKHLVREVVCYRTA